MNNFGSSPVASDLDWGKSSYSNTEGGQCVEVAKGRGGDVVHVRDSKAIAGPIVTVSREAWAGLLTLTVQEPSS